MKIFREIYGLFRSITCFLGFHHVMFTWEGYERNCAQDHGVWKGKCKHCCYRRTKVEKLFMLLALCFLPALAFADCTISECSKVSADKKELCSLDGTWCLPIPLSPTVIATVAPLPKSADFLTHGGMSLNCPAYTGDLPLMPADEYKTCAARKPDIAMDSKGRELFTVEKIVTGGFRLIDHSNGHSYIFFYGGDKGMRDKLLFPINFAGRPAPTNGDYVYVQNE